MPREEEKDRHVDKTEKRSRSRRRSRSDRESRRRKSRSRSTSKRGHGDRSRRDRYTYDNRTELKILDRLERLEQKLSKQRSESPRPPILKPQQRIALSSVNSVDVNLSSLGSPESRLHVDEDLSDDSVLSDPGSERVQQDGRNNRRTVDENEGELEINAPNEDLLLALGVTPEGVSKWGPPVAQGLIDRWVPIVTCGLPTDARTSVMGTYKIPENLQLLEPPKLNPELESFLVADGKKKDEIISGFQRQLATGITAMGNVISKFIASGTSSDFLKEACSGLGDSARILLDLHHSMSIKRRLSIIPAMSAGSVVRKTAETSTFDTALFGQDLAQRVKVAKELDKTAAELHPRGKPPSNGKRMRGVTTNPSSAPAFKKSYLNSKRPPAKKPAYSRGAGGDTTVVIKF